MKLDITLEEAQELILKNTEPAMEVLIPLSDAWGRTLSRPITATTSLPFFNRSPLDGYALLAEDTKSASTINPVRLQVLEEIPAGFVPSHRVVSGTASKILTGAPVPEGADVVIRYEDVERDHDMVLIFEPLRSGDNVVYIGEDIKKGVQVAEKGDAVNSPLLGLLVTLGIKEVWVYETVIAAIISTGDELLDIGNPLQPGKIYDSNRHILAARCRENGVKPVSFGPVADRVEAVAGALTAGLEAADVVISTGGVSVGDYDVVKDALKTIGADIIFWRVCVKPGAPLVVAVKEKRLIVGLSGNPVSSLITFDLFVVPLLRKRLGRRKWLPAKVQGTLLDGFKKASDQRRILRGHLSVENGINRIRLTGVQNNSALLSMIESNVYIDIPAGSKPLTSGETVFAFLIDPENITFRSFSI